MKQFALKNTERGVSRLALLLLFAPLVLLTAVALAIAVDWQYFKGTPSYSVALLADAAQRDDAKLFDDVFDMDQVVSNFLNDTALRVTNSADFANSVTSRLKPVSTTVSDTITPVVRERLRQKIDGFSPNGANWPFFLKAWAIRFKTKVDRKDEKARVRISDSNAQLELWLAPAGDHWRVVAVKDEVLAAQVAADITRELSDGPSLIRQGVKSTLPGIETLIPQR